MREGIESCISLYSVDESAARLEALLKEKGVTLFCVIHFSNDAKAAGFDMPPTKMLLFGNPKTGTPLMLAAPGLALDLPLRLLIAESANGQVTLSWNNPAWLQQRHGFPADLVSNLAAAGVFARTLSK
jgi:uncharacterized protein (DUF302 family)